MVELSPTSAITSEAACRHVLWALQARFRTSRVDTPASHDVLRHVRLGMYPDVAIFRIIGGGYPDPQRNTMVGAGQGGHPGSFVNDVKWVREPGLSYQQYQ